MFKYKDDNDSNNSEHAVKHNPLHIKIRQGVRVNNADSIIWPWAFPRALKEYLNDYGQIIFVKAGYAFTLDEKPKQLAVIIQGSIKVSNHVFKHKHSILDFHLPSDAFEYSHEKIFGAEIKYEAIEDCFIYVAPFDLCEHNNSKLHSEYMRFLHHKRKQKLREIQTHLSILAIFNAQEKVAFFLVDMYRRLAIKKSVHLPMSRVDISHYLSLTPETVSRELNRFDHIGYVKLRRADIIFKDVDALVKVYS